MGDGRKFGRVHAGKGGVDFAGGDFQMVFLSGKVNSVVRESVNYFKESAARKGYGAFLFNLATEFDGQTNF